MEEKEAITAECSNKFGHCACFYGQEAATWVEHPTIIFPLVIWHCCFCGATNKDFRTKESGT